MSKLSIKSEQQIIDIAKANVAECENGYQLFSHLVNNVFKVTNRTQRKQLAKIAGQVWVEYKNSK